MSVGSGRLFNLPDGSGFPFTIMSGDNRGRCKPIFSSSRIRIAFRKGRGQGQVEKGLGLLPADRWESFKEILDALSGLEVIDQDLDRYPRTPEYRRSAENPPISVDDIILRHCTVPMYAAVAGNVQTIDTPV
jgi:hypothetical protein